MSNVSKLRSCINRAKDEAGSIPQLIGQDAEDNLTAADKDIYQAEEVKDEAVEGAKFKVGDKVCAGDKRGTIEKVASMKLSSTPTYQIKLDDGSQIDRYEEELELCEDTICEAEDEEIDEIDSEESEVDAEDTEDIEDIEDNDVEDIEDHLDTDLADAEEETKDINENIVVFLYRAFAEINDNVKVFIEDEENEERDADLVSVLTEFKQGLPEVMDVIKDLAKTYVHSVELFDPEEEEEVLAEDPELEDPADAEEIVDAEMDMEDDFEDDLEDEATVEAYLKESAVEYKKFGSEYQIFARYSNQEQASKFENDLNRFKGAEVFNYAEIGEVHAFVNVK